MQEEIQTNPFHLDINEIQKFLPHRAPFLLVDRILSISHPTEKKFWTQTEKQIVVESGTKVVGLKNITYNEPYFQGHFPGFPIVPGVLLIEMMAQVASFAIYPSFSKDVSSMRREFQCFLVGVDQARFRKPVIPGNSLHIEAVLLKSKGNLWNFDCLIFVENQKVVEAKILANLIAKPVSKGA